MSTEQAARPDMDEMPVMEPGNGQCDALWDDARCPNAATQTVLSRCDCGHLAGGDCCDRCAATLRQMKALGTCICFRCQNDRRNPHICRTTELTR